ncbi:MAG: PAS domain-containing sensor histidine kinase [Bacteroidota bacterium]
MKPNKTLSPEIYLQQTMDNMFIHCFIIGFDWRFQYLNESVADISNSTIDSLLDRDIRISFPNSSNKEVYDFFQVSLEKKTRQEFRASFTFNNGSQRWFRFKVNSINVGIFVVANEITETILAQEEIKKQKELLETAEKIAHLGSWEIDIQTGAFYWSDESYKILEYTKGDIIPCYEAFINRIHPDDREIVREAYLNVTNRSESNEIVHRILLPDGRVKYLHQRWEIYTDLNGIPIKSVGTSQDITPQVLSELSLKKSRLQYEQVVDNISDGVISYTTKEEILFVNDQFLDMFGLSKEEILNIKLSDLIAETDREKIGIQHQKRIAGEVVPEMFEFKGKHSNGSILWFEARACNVVIDGKLNNIQFAVRDITKQKSSTQRLEVQNEELRKINFELDRFVYSASHDLRAPLLSVLSLIELAEQAHNKEETDELLKMMQNSILRLDNSIKNMLSYSENSRQTITIKKLDVNDIINCELTQYEILLLSKNIKTDIKIDEQIPFFSDKGRIILIAKNLISNAIHFQRMQEDNKYIKIHFQSSKEFGHLTVEDNGEGIPEGMVSKIFDMFYRTSEQSEGTGLGLYICKESLNKLNGEIKVNSAVGKGTRFDVFIPNHYNP